MADSEDEREIPEPLTSFKFRAQDWFDMDAIEQQPRDFIGLYYCDDDIDDEPTGWYRAVNRNGKPLRILGEEGIVWAAERGVDGTFSLAPAINIAFS